MKCVCLFLALVLLTPGDALAQQSVNFDFLTRGANQLVTAIEDLVTRVDADPVIAEAPDMLWRFFAVLLILGLLFRYVTAGLILEDIFGTIILIAMVRVLLDNFGPITAAIWDFVETYSLQLQRLAVGNDDLMYIPAQLAETLQGFSLIDLGITDGIIAIFGLGALVLAIMVFLVLAAIASSWALWGYAVAKLIGLLFLPFVMIDRMSFLFDGWLRFFLSFMVYNLVARVNLILVVLALQSFFGLSGLGFGGAGDSLFTWDGGSQHIFELLGLFFFLGIGSLSLLSTAQFAASIVSGATGAGSALRYAAFAMAFKRRL